MTACSTRPNGLGQRRVSRGRAAGRSAAADVWCDHSILHGAWGPMQCSMAALVHAWRPTAAWKAARRPALEAHVGGIDGLFVCREFLNAEEVRCLRNVFAAHQGWTMYQWGSVLAGKHKLAASLQRIDFGLPDMSAEGVAAAGTATLSTRPIGEHQQQVISLFEARLCVAFAAAKLWSGQNVNMVQLSQIAPGQSLGYHVDRRDKWLEGIASVAWSQLACPSDPRGDQWILGMQQGYPPQTTRSFDLPAGCAYLLSRSAQGRTNRCEQGRVAHEVCSCCWTHGIWNPGDNLSNRQSVTLRCYDSHWGRRKDD